MGDTLTFGTGETPTRLVVVGIVAHSIPGDSQEALLVGWSDALGPFGATGADLFAVRYDTGQEAAARPHRLGQSVPRRRLDGYQAAGDHRGGAAIRLCRRGIGASPHLTILAPAMDDRR